jgi:transposase-like protein
MAKKKARKFSTEFRLEAVRRMAEVTSTVGLAEELGVRRKLLYQWRDRLQAEGNAGLERRVGRPPGSRPQKISRSVASCRAALKTVLPHFRCKGQAACGTSQGSTRALSSSNPARPYIWRLMAFRRLICPSMGPLLHGVVIESSTAFKSRRSVLAN